MREEFLPLTRPALDEEDIAAVVAVLRSGWITTGPKARQLEQRMGEWTGAAGCAAVSSGTAGMHLVLEALGIGPGDEVVTPSMTWVSTPNLVLLRGATPVFADVDRDTLMVTRDTLEPCLTERTRLVIPVHFAGASLDLDPIRDLCRGRGIALVEDSAHAIGSWYRGEPVGRRGTSVFSLQAIKNVTTAEGGLVCSEDQALLERIRRLRFHGLGATAYDRKVQGRAPQSEVLEPGYKYNLPDMAAALGLGQLARLDSLIERRRRIAGYYTQRFEEIEEITPLTVPAWPMRHSWHLFVVRLDIARCGQSRDSFIEGLKTRNIGAGIHFRAVHRQRYYRESIPLPAGALPETEWNSERILSLPLSPAMVEEDVDDVVEAIEKELRR